MLTLFCRFGWKLATVYFNMTEQSGMCTCFKWSGRIETNNKITFLLVGNDMPTK